MEREQTHMGFESFAVKCARFAVKRGRSHMRLETFAVKCAPFAVKRERSHMGLGTFAVTRRALQGVGGTERLIRAALVGCGARFGVARGEVEDFGVLD
jgi:hypothetical protein